MKTRNDFFNGDEEIAICGTYIDKDSIHVGLAWKSEEGNRIIHFLNGRTIPFCSLNLPMFDCYFFKPIEDFPAFLIPSLSALSDLISNNQINNLIFQREGVVYNGGKFEVSSGILSKDHESERIVNCGVFVIALLNTYDYLLLDWESFPLSKPNAYYLDTWLEHQGIRDLEKEYYYRQAREIRGKHVIVCPDIKNLPAKYKEIQPLSEGLINCFFKVSRA